jgi:probable rRNA maturation factor
MDQSDPSSSPTPDADDHPPPDCSAQSSSIEVELIDPLNLLTEHAKRSLADLATRTLAALPNTGQVRVLVVNDDRMVQAHLKYSNLSTTTDVLTFDLAEPIENFDQKIIDTDLTICYDQAKRQAKERTHRVERELLLYIIHGTLHCLGYDDHTDADYQRIHQREDELLATIGIDPTFFTTQSNPSNPHKEPNP